CIYCSYSLSLHAALPIFRDSPARKCSTAADTGRSRTSRMFIPPSVYSSTCAWKPLPSHSSQGADTSPMSAMSEQMTPAPLHAGQAPSEFALNREGLTPLALAKALRIGSSRPVWVAGLLRLDPL